MPKAMDSLDLFFTPESIALVGASRTPGKIGHTILENLKLSFQGKIYPINPQATEILGLQAFPSVMDVPEPIDLAIIVIPAEEVPKEVGECVKKKIKAMIIISSGFGETGDKKREEEILNHIKGKARVLGPNCLGVYTKNLDMFFLPRDRLKRPPEGSIAFITQSGAFGSTILDLIAGEGVGISKFVSIGNMLDIEETDLLRYLEKDLQTRCIALYVESIKKGQEFVELARKITKKKPIVAIKAGKTVKGREAVLSHTGALVGPAEVYEAAFKQAGIVEADSTEELFDFSKALASQPTPKDNRIAIVTDGGGFGIVAADQTIRMGLELPKLSDESIKALKSFLPKYTSYHNPIDISGDATTERYQKTLDVVFKDKGISGVVCIALLQVPMLDEGVIDVLRDCKIYGKSLTVCSTGGSWTQERAKKLEAVGVPVYPTPERAVNAMWALWEYGKVLKRK